MNEFAIPPFENMDAVSLLLSSECDADSLWTESDLQELWLLQLDAVLWTDCATAVGQVPALWIHQSAQAHDPAITTYRHLFWHGSPSLDLLKAIQNVAQTLLHMYEASVPRVVARLIYDLTVAVALEKHAARITELPYVEIEKSLAHFESMAWIEPETLARCRELLRCLRHGSQ